MGSPPERQVRWFRPCGCVEARADGTFAVYVGGSLIGTFSTQNPAQRDLLIVLVMEDSRTRPGEIARAFRVSTETVRRARARARNGGLAAVTQGRKRGAPSKRKPALQRRVSQLFEQGLTVHATLRAIRGKVSYGTLRRMREQWAAERDKHRERAESIPTERTEAVRPLAVADCAAEAPAAASSAPPAGDTKQPEPPHAATAGPADSAGRACSAISLKQGVSSFDGQTVEHAGAWIMLGMLHSLGLYTVAKRVGGNNGSQVALRAALDVVTLALALDPHCTDRMRLLTTPSVAALLRWQGTVSASWAAEVLKSFAERGSTALHLGIARAYLQRARREEGLVVLYVDSLQQPPADELWPVQDRPLLAEEASCYVRDEDGRPLLRVPVAPQESLANWLQPIASFARNALGPETRILLAFDRGGTSADQMATLDTSEVEFVTYERTRHDPLSASALEQTVTLMPASGPRQPLVVKYTETLQDDGSRGRKRVRRIALQMPDRNRLGVLAVSSAPPAELIRVQLQRRRINQQQSNHHTMERWNIDQPKPNGSNSRPRRSDSVIPNPARRRLENALRLARSAQGEARRKLARLELDDPERAQLQADLRTAAKQQEQLEALRPQAPTRELNGNAELARCLACPPGEYRAVIDTLRIALANTESDLAAELAPHLPQPHQAKRALANLLAAPGGVQLGKGAVTVSLAPTADTREREALAALLDHINAMKLTLPGDPNRHWVRFRLEA
jgi:transposase